LDHSTAQAPDQDRNQNQPREGLQHASGVMLTEGHVVDHDSGAGSKPNLAAKIGAPLPGSLVSSAAEVSEGNQLCATTRSQHGISQPKTYSDGTIRYSFVASSGEPSTMHEALGDPN
jgi:nucleoside diphosphate kinase